MKIEKRDTESDRIPYSISHVVAYISACILSFEILFQHQTGLPIPQLQENCIFPATFLCKLSANCLQCMWFCSVIRAIVVSRSFEVEFMM